MYKLDPEFKKLWVAALRSGEYQQTRQTLYRTEGDQDYPAGMCCLGVACDLAIKHKIVEAAWHATGNRMEFVLANEGAGTNVPPIELFYKIITDNTRPVNEWQLPDGSTLYGLNDKGYTFAQLADLIEEHM
jgi:hypothetical protein